MNRPKLVFETLVVSLSNALKTQAYSKEVSNSRNLLRKYWLESILGASLFAVFLYAALFGTYFVNGAFSYNSLIHYGSCFILASYFLNRQGVKVADRILYSLAIMASGIVLYEIVYHYGFGISYSILVQNATFFGLDSNGTAFSLDWFVIIFVIPFAWRQYMSLGNWSLLILVTFEALVMFAWISTGYPQFQYPSWWPAYKVLFDVIPVVNGTPSSSSILFYGGLFGELAKTISVIPAFFFNKK